jgi:hypothetical protein
MEIGIMTAAMGLAGFLIGAWAARGFPTTWLRRP